MSGRIPQGGETREERAGRILNDYLDRRARGTAEPEAELLNRHSDLADELRLHLNLLHDLRRSDDPLESLVARGLLRSSPDPRYPAQLGAFKVTAFLGRGGMGVVVKAYEESLNRTVALKVLRPELAVDASSLTRFEREAKAAAALRHPNIVTVYAVGTDQGLRPGMPRAHRGPSLAQMRVLKEVKKRARYEPQVVLGQHPNPVLGTVSAFRGREYRRAHKRNCETKPNLVKMDKVGKMSARIRTEAKNGYAVRPPGA